MKYFLFAFVLVASVLLGGTQTHAYGVTDENVVRLNDSTVLYTITYEFGFLNAELYMPMTAMRNGRTGNASTSAVYSLVGSDGKIFDEGIARAVVVSTTKAQKDEYYAPYGKKAFFTLLVLVDMPQKAGEEVHLEVDSVPLTIVRKGGKREPYMMRKENLAAFRTTATEL